MLQDRYKGTLFQGQLLQLFYVKSLIFFFFHYNIQKDNMIGNDTGILSLIGARFIAQQSPMAETNGQLIARISESDSATYQYSQGNFTWFHLLSLTTRSCRLLHGSWSWAAQTVNQTFMASLSKRQLLQHWWIVIETSGNRYFIIQFYGNDVYTMRKCKDFRKCDENGLSCAQKRIDSDIWTQSSYSGPAFGHMDDVIDWLKSKEFSPKYSLLNHNCQDLCKAIYKRFQKRKEHENYTYIMLA